jgi:hypothetical protein
MIMGDASYVISAADIAATFHSGGTGTNLTKMRKAFAPRSTEYSVTPDPARI